MLTEKLHSLENKTFIKNLKELINMVLNLCAITKTNVKHFRLASTQTDALSLFLWLVRKNIMAIFPEKLC